MRAKNEDPLNAGVDRFLRFARHPPGGSRAEVTVDMGKQSARSPRQTGRHAGRIGANRRAPVGKPHRSQAVPDPGPSPAGLRAHASALLHEKRFAPAIGALMIALDAEPMHADTHGMLARALVHDGQPGAALAHAELAFRLRPTADHAVTLSCVLIELGRPGDAIELASAASRTVPWTLELAINQVIALEDSGRVDEAIACARRAVGLAPASGVARHTLAVSLLSSGQLTAEAWEMYEGRFALPGRQSLVTAEGLRWRGQDPAGRTILLHAEQGLGDTLQFMRYVPVLAGLGARVVAVVQPTLVSLLAGMAGLAEIRAVGQGLPAFDLYAPLLSLPGLLGTTVETIPPPAPIRRAGQGARGSGGRLKVGLVWAGNPTFVVDRKRSIPGRAFAVLAGIQGVEFHNLQFGQVPAPELLAIDGMPSVQDFAGTAGFVMTLDLVIAVDTAVAHLAATLGVPVWLLTRHRGCWRWLSRGSDTPWYPAMTIYRQGAEGDWTPVLAQVRADLAAAAHAAEERARQDAAQSGAA